MLRAALTALAVLFAFPAFAQVSVNAETNSMTVKGVTSTFQAIEVSDALAENEIDTVYMFGIGGDYYAGLQIGRMLRKAGVRVIIPQGKECISACAFAAMAGEEVHIDGVMLLHRPYIPGVPTMVTIEEIAGKFGEAYVDLAIYFDEVGYPPRLARQILVNSTPCQYIVVKQDEELQKAREDGFLVGYSKDDRCFD